MDNHSSCFFPQPDCWSPYTHTHSWHSPSQINDESAGGRVGWGSRDEPAVCVCVCVCVCPCCNGCSRPSTQLSARHTHSAAVRDLPHDGFPGLWQREKGKEGRRLERITHANTPAATRETLRTQTHTNAFSWVFLASDYHCAAASVWVCEVKSDFAMFLKPSWPESFYIWN